MACDCDDARSLEALQKEYYCSQLATTVLPQIDVEKDYICKNDTWHIVTSVYTDGVLTSEVETDLGTPCDEPQPIEPKIEDVEICDAVTGTIHVIVNQYTYPDPTDLTNVVITQLSDIDSGIKCGGDIIDSETVVICNNGFNEYHTFTTTNGVRNATPLIVVTAIPCGAVAPDYEKVVVCDSVTNTYHVISSSFLAGVETVLADVDTTIPCNLDVINNETVTVCNNGFIEYHTFTTTNGVRNATPLVEVSAISCGVVENDLVRTNWLPICVDGAEWYVGERSEFNNTTGVETLVKVYKEGADGAIVLVAPTGTITEGYCPSIVTPAVQVDQTHVLVSGTGNVPAGLKTVTINNITGITTINGGFALGNGRRVTSISFDATELSEVRGLLPAYTLAGGTFQWVGLQPINEQ